MGRSDVGGLDLAGDRRASGEGAQACRNPINGRERAAGVRAEDCLLLMPCGESKLDHVARADELYTGPMWQTLRTHGRAPLRLLILSAEYGFVLPHRHLPPYERRMTPERADELVGALSLGALAEGLGSALVRDVQIVGGAEYRRAMRAAVAAMLEGGLIDAGASVREITGQIGEQRAALGQYLQALCDGRAWRVGDALMVRQRGLGGDADTWARTTVAKCAGDGFYWVRSPGMSNAECPACPQDLAALGSCPDAGAPLKVPRQANEKERLDGARVAARAALQCAADRAEDAGASQLAKRLRSLAADVRPSTGGAKVVAPAHARRIAARFGVLLARAQADPADTFFDVDAYRLGRRVSARKSSAQAQSRAGRPALPGAPWRGFA